MFENTLRNINNFQRSYRRKYTCIMIKNVKKIRCQNFYNENCVRLFIRYFYLYGKIRFLEIALKCRDAKLKINVYMKR